MPMLSCKAFATNSLKYKFMQDVWFGRDCVCSNIEHLSNIDEIRKIKLEPLCCTVCQKIYLTVTGLWNRGPLKILNGIKLILDDQGNHLDSYTISLESFRSFRGPLFRKPVTGHELFLLFLTANRLQQNYWSQKANNVPAATMYYYTRTGQQTKH